MEPRLRDRPITLHGGRGNLQRLRRFVDRETGEESHFDDLAQPGIERRQVGQRFVERQDVHGELVGAGADS
jgi:hypothetical protein